MSSTSGIDAAVERSDLVRDALDTARRAHAGQLRRGSDGHPFIDHPVAVAEILLKHRYNDDVLAAALLHDVVEKSDIELPELRERFGDPVADLVEAMTEDETIDPYEERKEEHRRRVAEAGPAALAIFAADKQTNVAMLREAYALIAEGVSDELAVSLDLKIYVWEADLEMLFNEAAEMPLTDEFADEMVGLWGDRFRAVDSSPD
ncbi:MAG TPA: HD domain-containing protein [Solirubrobacterales bacterium]|jgi:(p)ppGpp synthase/HD superfamily hydrolase|nr:HD domain-containing protein [Solirubrobacterales bacterium]